MSYISNFSIHPGNIIPSEWYLKFTNNRGAPDLSLMSVLSEIVYWYRPKRVKDSNTGDITHVNKFLGDTWQTSYEHFERKFAFNREKLRRIFVKLEQMGICSREFRTVKLRGQAYNNRLFIHLSSDFLNSCISNKIRVSDCENYTTKSNTSFSASKKEGGSPHFDGDHISNKNNIKKDRSTNDASIEALSGSNFLENSLVLKEKAKNDHNNFLKISSGAIDKNNNALALQISSHFKNNSNPDNQTSSANKKKPVAFINTKLAVNVRKTNYANIISTAQVKNPNIFTKPRKLVDFYPLNATDCAQLQSLSGRQFSLNATNEILHDMSKRLTDRVFYSRKGFLSYMSSALRYEMRDAVKTSNESFKIKANLSQQESRAEEIENYLTEIEYSSAVSPEWHLKKKLACVLESTKAYNFLKAYRAITIDGNTAKIHLYKHVHLSQLELEQVLSQVKATHERFENGEYAPIQKIELIMPKVISKNLSANKTNLETKPLPNTLWGRVRKSLIGVYGEAIDTSWFSKLEATEDTEAKAINLKASSEFIKDWIERNYEQAIEQAAESMGVKIRGFEC